MKKTISVFLTMLLIFCSFSFLLPVYAAAPEDTLDLSQYSLEDIAAMSAEEYRALLRDFERVMIHLTPMRRTRLWRRKSRSRRLHRGGLLETLKMVSM